MIDRLFGFALGEGGRTPAWTLAIRDAGVTTFNELVAHVQRQMDAGVARYTKPLGGGKGSDADARAREDYTRMVENGNLVARAPIPAASVRNLKDLIGVKKRLAARTARS